MTTKTDLELRRRPVLSGLYPTLTPVLLPSLPPSARQHHRLGYLRQPEGRDGERQLRGRGPDRLDHHRHHHGHRGAVLRRAGRHHPQVGRRLLLREGHLRGAGWVSKHDTAIGRLLVVGNNLLKCFLLRNRRLGSTRSLFPCVTIWASTSMQNLTYFLTLKIIYTRFFFYLNLAANNYFRSKDINFNISCFIFIQVERRVVKRIVYWINNPVLEWKGASSAQFNFPWQGFSWAYQHVFLSLSWWMSFPMRVRHLDPKQGVSSL